MYIMKQDLVRIIIFLVCSKCQFLIGNVYQLVLSVSNYDTTPFSSQNQSKIFKKYSQERLIYLQFAEKNAGPESKKYDNLYKWPIINLKLKRRIDNFE